MNGTGSVLNAVCHLMQDLCYGVKGEFAIEDVVKDGISFYTRRDTGFETWLM